MFDVDFARAQFPALESPWALMDNAGGSVTCRQVIRRVTGFLERHPVQLGASYPLSVEATEAVDAGRRAAGVLVGASEEEIVLGPSSTALVRILASSLRPLWKDGDEVVVTNLDHEANVGPWRALEATGIRVLEWRFRPETATLELEDLEPLLSPRTRLVAFTHCANVTGTIHDVPKITRRVREAGALSCVDGVAFAPHRRVDVQTLGADFYLASLYKVFGPHVGVLYGRRELLLAAKSQGHVFHGADALPMKLEPGGVNYELVASLPGILEYFTELGRRHDLGLELDLDKCFALTSAHEAQLAAPLLSFLREQPRVRILGDSAAAQESRVATVAFVVDGRKSSEVPPVLERRQVAARFGHFYAYRPIRDLGWLERDGVVRVSLLHYNTEDEVGRLLEGLEEAL